jgi:hypothetical protein
VGRSLRRRGEIFNADVLAAEAGQVIWARRAESNGSSAWAGRRRMEGEVGSTENLVVDPAPDRSSLPHGREPASTAGPVKQTRRRAPYPGRPIYRAWIAALVLFKNSPLLAAQRFC